MGFAWIISKGIKVSQLQMENNLFVIFTIGSSIYMEVGGEHSKIPPLEYVYLVIFMGIIFFLSHFCLMRALLLGHIGKVSICNYLTVVYAYIFEFIWMHEKSAIIGIIGALLILLALCFVILN